MKRKADLEQDESRLSRLLFNKSDNLAKKLETSRIEKHELNDSKAAWIDEDDVCVTNKKSKKVVTETLKEKFEGLLGTPSWAKLENKVDSETDNLLRKVGHLKKKSRSEGLPKERLQVKKFPKINGETYNEGPIISCVKFHPKISVALVAGYSNTVSLFSISTDICNKLHSLKLKDWKIGSAHFTPNGSDVLISSKHSSTYCRYNLVTSQPKPEELPSVLQKAFIFEMSPNGKYLAVSEGFDELYLISQASRELLKVLKHNSPIVSISFSPKSDLLYSYGAQGEISVWDLSTYRAVKKFYDHGCVTASIIESSPCGRLLATGSGEGIVNVYETSKLTTSEPIPTKILSHLRTKITNLKFNPTSEILATASSIIPNSIKFIHTPTYTIFGNFPAQSIELGRINAISFSPNSGFVGIGNNRNSAELYRLKYYKNY